MWLVNDSTIAWRIEVSSVNYVLPPEYISVCVKVSVYVRPNERRRSQSNLNSVTRLTRVVRSLQGQVSDLGFRQARPVRDIATTTPMLLFISLLVNGTNVQFQVQEVVIALITVSISDTRYFSSVTRKVDDPGEAD